ncbi:unnamed protein product [Polarella glacialis]|uniref:Uncharacterized protein n=1 Tax=Polarella glacialis TaxID=89957 RepID=A0A813G0I1_POLGL|nr:unnamed protein product [Polarella glacialis]
MAESSTASRGIVSYFWGKDIPIVLDGLILGASLLNNSSASRHLIIFNQFQGPLESLLQLFWTVHPSVEDYQSRRLQTMIRQNTMARLSLVWNKLLVHTHGLTIAKQVLMLDLDMMTLQNLDKIWEHCPPSRPNVPVRIAAVQRGPSDWDPKYPRPVETIVRDV